MGAVKKIHEIIILLKLSFEKRKLRQNQKFNIGGLFIFLHRFCSGCCRRVYMTNENWKKVQERLRAGTDVKLLIDGYEVELRIVKRRLSMFAVLPFINGEYKSEWLLDDCEERMRFYRTSTVIYYSERERRIMFKNLTRKEYLKWLNENLYCEYSAVWTSFEFMKLHFEEENTNIELI